MGLRGYLLLPAVVEVEGPDSSSAAVSREAEAAVHQAAEREEASAAAAVPGAAACWDGASKATLWEHLGAKSGGASAEKHS